MRVYIGGILMEANSFNPDKSGCETFMRHVWLKGTQIESLCATAVEISGFYAYLNTIPDVEIIPGFFAFAESSGPIKASEFEKLTGYLFDSLKSSGKVDAVLLSLHGAMQSEIVDDCDGYILEQVRKIVGEDVAIVSSLDLHACMTEKMVMNLDGFAGYLTMPHSDTKETGYRAAQVLKNLSARDKKPCKLLKRIPLVMPLQNSNSSQGPIKCVIEKCKQILSMPGVLSASLFLTQPWLDTPYLGCEMCIFFDDEAMRSLYDDAAQGVLDLIWENRNEFYPAILDIDRAIQKCKVMGKPVCLVDLGDSVPGGSTGDSTVALRSLVQADLDINSCIFLKDPETVHKALQVGMGGLGKFNIGGSDKEGFNCRVDLEARVISINTKPFENLGPLYKGLIVNPGIRVLLRVGNIHIIACENACTTYDRNMMLTMGIDPRQIEIIVQKASNSFKITFEGVMGSYLYAQTPGYTDPILTRLPFTRITRPIYPFDEM